MRVKENFICNFCNKEFSRNYTLKRHMISYHSDLLDEFLEEQNDKNASKKSDDFHSKTFLSRTSDFLSHPKNALSSESMSDAKKSPVQNVQNVQNTKKNQKSDKKNLNYIVRSDDENNKKNKKKISKNSLKKLYFKEEKNLNYIVRDDDNNFEKNSIKKKNL